MNFPPLNWHAHRTQLVAQRQTLYKSGRMRPCTEFYRPAFQFNWSCSFWTKAQYVHKILVAWAQSMFAFLWLTCFGFQVFWESIKMAMQTLQSGRQAARLQFNSWFISKKSKWNPKISRFCCGFWYLCAFISCAWLEKPPCRSVCILFFMVLIILEWSQLTLQVLNGLSENLHGKQMLFCMCSF